MWTAMKVGWGGLPWENHTHSFEPDTPPEDNCRHTTYLVSVFLASCGPRSTVRCSVPCWALQWEKAGLKWERVGL